MNNPPDTLLESLRAWPDLWHRPALFALVHGASEARPSRATLLSALLAVEPVDLPEAWHAIVERDDLAAAQAAYERLAPRISLDKLNDARRRFERRAASVRARAVPLSGSLRTAVNRALDEAIAIMEADPAEAERTLMDADLQARDGEAQALAALKRTFAADTDSAGGGPRGARLRDALEAGDLRLACIVAGQLGIADSSSQPASPADVLLHDPWIDRQSTVDLLNWCRDPTLAPAGRLPATALADQDMVLLDRLAESLEAGTELDLAEAEQTLRLAVRSLADRADPDFAITDQSDLGGELWTFNLVGASVVRLFPHVADDHGVLVVVPRRPTLQFPLGPPGRRFVVFDPFESWAFLAKHDSIQVTPRMVAKALLAANDVEDSRDSRTKSFVRLQSAAIAVRPLILNVLAHDEARCRRLIDASPLAILSTEEIVRSLAHTLDIYVDDGDLAALRDACGDRFTLLLEVLHILAESLESAPVSHRRFDSLSALLRPDIEEKVAALVEADLRRHLVEEQRIDITLILGDAAALLENCDPGDGPSLAITRLAAGLVAAGCASTPEEGLNRLAELLSLGLLLSTTDFAEPTASFRIQRSLPLPGRILLRMDG